MRMFLGCKAAGYNAGYLTDRVPVRLADLFEHVNGASLLLALPLVWAISSNAAIVTVGWTLAETEHLTGGSHTLNGSDKKTLAALRLQRLRIPGDASKWR